MESIVEKAFGFARAKHQGQKDDCGKDYFIAHIEHMVAVLGILLWNAEKCPPGTDTAYMEYYTRVMTAAVLHDTIEDTDTTYEDLVREFGQEIADLVMEVTHEGTDDDFGYYFPRLKSRDAIIIKFADRLSNLSRMESWSAERKEHYLRKSKFWKDGSEKRKKITKSRGQRHHE